MKPVLFRNKKAIIAAIAVLLIAGIAFIVKTWPDNIVATAAYYVMGKPAPGKNKEDLRDIKTFLSAKRNIDAKQYGAARTELEGLAAKVETKFLFFREIFLYLGFVYDVTGDFAREEALYSRLATQDPTFSKFMFGLYHVRKGKITEARQELFEALKLDDQHKRLGKYRQTAVKALQNVTVGSKANEGP